MDIEIEPTAKALDQSDRSTLVLPTAAELESVPGFVADPLGERSALRSPRLLHKYRGRALLITTQACAIHCRYCFRREFPYSEQVESGRWDEALRELAGDSSLEEVILSGGDPLSLGDARLESLLDALGEIPHLRRLRIHTRHPVVMPTRITTRLCELLRWLPWPVVMVVHANHPNEIDHEVKAAFRLLREAEVTLLNQSVLLRGINDSADVLALLSEALFDAGALPYYLHMLDRVNGTAHFEVEESRAREIARELAARLPGYLVPRLVREVAGADAKVPLLY
jgi:EF-P beta-lysylation protein EpmB